MEPYVENLVVDAAGFIKYAKLEQIGRKIYTVREIVDEIKDKATLERLQILPYELNFLSPNSDDLKFVTEFSKKTGDYPSLSANDLKLLAAVYHLEKLHVGGAEHLKTEPQKNDHVTKKNNEPENLKKPDMFEEIDEKSKISNGEPEIDENPENLITSDKKIIKNSKNKPSNLPPGFYVPKSVQHLTENFDKLVLEAQSDGHVTNEIEENNDEGWITPSNLCKFNATNQKIAEKSRRPIAVGCITGDFAVQNVLLHIGLNVISIDGLLIKRLNTYILRCFLCFKTTSHMTKKFCPECGNQSLKRVAVTVRNDGTQIFHISRRRKINTRNTNKSIPMPKGGKHADNPILCEDQPIPENRLSKKALQNLNVLDDDYESRDSPFLQKDVYSRSALLGVRKLAANKNKRRK